MMAANYRHIGGGENRLGRHYSRFSGFCPTAFLADQSLASRNLQNGGSNRRSRVSAGHGRLIPRTMLDWWRKPDPFVNPLQLLFFGNFVVRGKLRVFRLRWARKNCAD